MKHFSSTFAISLTLSALSLDGNIFAQYNVTTLPQPSLPNTTYTAFAIAADRAGNVYASATADTFAVVMKVGAQNNPFVGATQSVSGSSCPFSFSSTNYDLHTAMGLAVDSSAQNVYIAQISGPAIVHSNAGMVTCLTYDNTLPGAQNALGVAADDAGNVYYSGLAGYGQVFAVPSGAMQAKLLATLPCPGAVPAGLALDRNSNLYIADQYCHVVWQVSPGGKPVVFAGIPGSPGYSGDGGPANQALLDKPESVAVDLDGTVYIAEYGNTVIRQVKNNVITTIAGNRNRTTTVPVDGEGASALFMGPMSITVGPGGVLYVGDTPGSGEDASIRKLMPAGAMMISPTPGSVLPCQSATFRWSGFPAGSQYQYQLDLSDKIVPMGQGDIYSSGPTPLTSAQISNLPCDGRAIYVRLSAQINGIWQSGIYAYTASQLMTINVSPSSLPATGGLVTVTIAVTNSTAQTLQLKVTSDTAGPHPCSINPFTGAVSCPQPAVLGTASVAPGVSQQFIFTTTIAPMLPGLTYAITRDFAAAITAPNGTTLDSAYVAQTQY
jgi:hypothetical protein